MRCPLGMLSIQSFGMDTHGGLKLKGGLSRLLIAAPCVVSHGLRSQCELFYWEFVDSIGFGSYPGLLSGHVRAVSSCGDQLAGEARRVGAGFFFESALAGRCQALGCGTSAGDVTLRRMDPRRSQETDGKQRAPCGPLPWMPVAMKLVRGLALPPGYALDPVCRHGYPRRFEARRRPLEARHCGPLRPVSQPTVTMQAIMLVFGRIPGRFPKEEEEEEELPRAEWIRSLSSTCVYVYV